MAGQHSSVMQVVILHQTSHGTEMENQSEIEVDHLFFWKSKFSHKYSLCNEKYMYSYTPWVGY